MKKIKRLAALLLAVAMLAPCAAFISCKQTDEAVLSPPTQEESSETLPPVQTPNEPQEEETPTVTPTPTPTPTPVVPKTDEYLRCTGSSVNLRSGAGTNFAAVGQAKSGETYAIVGKSGSWLKTYYQGKTAYISASYAAVFSLEKSKDDDVENVIAEGYKLLGVPYVYGAVRLHDGNGKLLKGFTAQKFDCSSLIQYIFYKGADTLLDVNTRTQVKQGTLVKKSELKRGDCLFFTNDSRKHLSGVERIGHVALYLGDNYILHTASDYARIEKISTSRWSYYIEARRFL